MYLINFLSTYHKKILLGDSSPKVDREDIFRLTVWNKTLHAVGNNGVGVVKICHIQKSIKSTLFPQCIIHIYAWMFPYGNTCSKIDDISVGRRQHLNVLDICREAECDTIVWSL
jgi:hypothetical protein